jgi:hypothetical protein
MPLSGRAYPNGRHDPADYDAASSAPVDRRRDGGASVDLETVHDGRIVEHDGRLDRMGLIANCATETARLDQSKPRASKSRHRVIGYRLAAGRVGPVATPVG